MFGIEMDFAFREDLIDAIVGYFKAWEYFLIRPKWGYFTSPLLYRKHLKSVARLTYLSHRIMHLKQVELEEQGPENVPDNFLKQLVTDMQSGDKVCHEANVVQCILEMLIAGTDTSSVSLFYTLVCLAETPEWEQR